MDAVAALRAGFAGGATRRLGWRQEQLRGLGSLLGNEQAAIEKALAADLGRSATETYIAEVVQPLREVRALSRGLSRWSRPRRVPLHWLLQPGRSVVRHEPLGVVLVIGAWNYPFNLVLVPLAAALAAGNCVLVKPSEHAPASAALLAELIPRYLDTSAVRVLTGAAGVVEASIEAGVDHVFFTGGSAAGRLVAERAGRHLTPVTLELGGKNPVIVAADADIEVAARRIAWGKLMNAGQACIAPDYVLVERGSEDALLAALSQAITAMYGDEPFESPELARIVNDVHLERLAGLLEDHGGEIVLGGRVDRPARYVAPTIVRQPSLHSALMREEIFGPILPVVAVDGLEDGARFVAERPEPLALYLFTSDSRAAEEVISRTRSGSVAVNTVVHQFASHRLPFGGVGASGSGRYHGRFGYEQLSQLRPVLIKPTRPDPSFAYPPFGLLRRRLLRRLLA